MSADPFAWPVDPRIAELHRKLARVEALADEWERDRDAASDYDHRRWHQPAAADLRAALDGDQ